MPQFRHLKTVGANFFALGLTIFVIGLAKKALLADSAAVFVAPRFDAATNGMPLDFVTAWAAALAYTVQLYFDFSGYSDMAIGAGLMFGIQLPLNFASPYKATSIIEFWRCWHITLSRFLRDYLYIPLGGNRKGPLRRYVNLLLTMLLGGFWHGAGWTFVIWGALHGTYLLINYSWRTLCKRCGWSFGTPATRLVAAATTFLAVVVAWVFFRASDVATAWSILQGMAGFQGMSSATLPVALSDNGEALAVVAVLLALAWLAPNTHQITGYIGPESSLDHRPGTSVNHPLRWQPTRYRAVAVGGLLGICLASLSRVSEFLYFQF